MIFNIIYNLYNNVNIYVTDYITVVTVLVIPG
jgi:hypothetical protein